MESEYLKRPWYFLNAHFETIIPSIFNKVEGVEYSRERLELDDGDFLDLDWLKAGSKRLMIISHGMDGSTDRHYMKRAAKFFHGRDWDILAWNNRGCSGELNRLARSYHHGETRDLSEVVERGLKEDYEGIVLLGISMGGCQTVKYFGDHQTDHRVLGGFTVSVSCNLEDTSIEAERRLGGFYGKRFLEKIKDTYKRKSIIHAELQQIDIGRINSFDELHEMITTKLFGFDSKEDFYTKSSCINYINQIKKPVFILNAKNDPLLGAKCFPIDEIRKHKHLYAEYPKYGGHVGFTIPGNKNSYIELRAEKFINEVILPSS